MNALDQLMKLDSGKLAVAPTSEMEIERLSELTGEPFVVKVKAISATRFMELVGDATDDNGNVDYGKAFEGNKLILSECMIEPNLKDKELQAHFGTATPKDLAEKIFLGGEIGAIADRIAAISGLGKSTRIKIKN